MIVTDWAGGMNRIGQGVQASFEAIGSAAQRNQEEKLKKAQYKQLMQEMEDLPKFKESVAVEVGDTLTSLGADQKTVSRTVDMVLATKDKNELFEKLGEFANQAQAYKDGDALKPTFGMKLDTWQQLNEKMSSKARMANANKEVAAAGQAVVPPDRSAVIGTSPAEVAQGQAAYDQGKVAIGAPEVAPRAIQDTPTGKGTDVLENDARGDVERLDILAGVNQGPKTEGLTTRGAYVPDTTQPTPTTAPVGVNYEEVAAIGQRNELTPEQQKQLTEPQIAPAQAGAMQQPDQTGIGYAQNMAEQGIPQSDAQVMGAFNTQAKNKAAAEKQAKQLEMQQARLELDKIKAKISDENADRQFYLRNVSELTDDMDSAFKIKGAIEKQLADAKSDLAAAKASAQFNSDTINPKDDVEVVRLEREIENLEDQKTDADNTYKAVKTMRDAARKYKQPGSKQPGAAPSPGGSKPKPPKVGDVVNGYQYLGGNLKSQSSWKYVGGQK